jgi:hypothetical protein
MTGAGSPLAAGAGEVAAGAPVPVLAGVASIVLPAPVAAGFETVVLESLAAMMGSVVTGAVAVPAGSLTAGVASVPAATAPIAVGTSGAATTQAHTKLRTPVRDRRPNADAQECRARSGPSPLERQHTSLFIAGTEGGRPPKRLKWSAILSVPGRAATYSCCLRNNPFIGSSIAPPTGSSITWDASSHGRSSPSQLLWMGTRRKLH